MIGQPGCHRWRTGAPLLRGARALGGQGLGEGLGYAGMGETKVVIRLEERQLVAQPVFTLAERSDPTTDGRHMLAEVEVEAFNERCVDLPTTR